MYSDFNCPVGADTPNAAWNLELIPTLDFELSVSQTLSKTVDTRSNNYAYDYDAESKSKVINSEETDWKELYKEDHYTPLDLIRIFKMHLQEELYRMGNTIDKSMYKHLIEECSNWVEDECEIIEN